MSLRLLPSELEASPKKIKKKKERLSLEKRSRVLTNSKTLNIILICIVFCLSPKLFDFDSLTLRRRCRLRIRSSWRRKKKRSRTTTMTSRFSMASRRNSQMQMALVVQPNLNPNSRRKRVKMNTMTMTMTTSPSANGALFLNPTRFSKSLPFLSFLALNFEKCIGFLVIYRKGTIFIQWVLFV